MGNSKFYASSNSFTFHVLINVDEKIIFPGKTLESLDPSLFTKNKPGKGGSNVKEREKQKEVAALEVLHDENLLCGGDLVTM